MQGLCCSLHALQAAQWLWAESVCTTWHCLSHLLSPSDLAAQLGVNGKYDPVVILVCAETLCSVNISHDASSQTRGTRLGPHAPEDVASRLGSHQLGPQGPWLDKTKNKHEYFTEGQHLQKKV